MLKMYKKIVVYGQTCKQKLAADAGEQKLKPRLVNMLALTAGALSAVLLFSVFFAFLVIPGSIVAYLLWRKFRNLPGSPVDNSLTAEYRVIKESEKK